jgi:hypothetical protein
VYVHRTLWPCNEGGNILKTVQSKIYVQRISWVLSEGNAIPGCAITGVDYLFKFIENTDFVSQLTVVSGHFFTI